MIIDDHPTLRAGLSALINDCDDMQVIAESHEGQGALKLYEVYQPDVTIMDLQLPDIDGEIVISKIVACDSDAVIIALTTYGGSDTIKRTVNAGARGFILKDAARNNITDAIRRAYDGKRVLDGAVLERYADAMGAENLTKREIEILKILALGNSNKRIAHELTISEATVKNHIANILQKLKAKDRT